MLEKGEGLRRAINKSLEIYEALKKIGKDEYADQLRLQIELASEEKFIVGVIGSAKRGKSTLINGLLGQQNDTLAPIDKFPATNVVTIFKRSDKTNVVIRYKSGKEEEISEHEIKRYACEEHNPNNRKEVKAILVEYPFLGLEKGVSIVDTPGANNALEAEHGEILYNFLPHANALIFLLSPDRPIVESEQNILQAIKGNDIKKVFFALNKMDRVASGSVSDADLEDCLEHNEKVLKSTKFENAKIYRISAKSFFETRRDSGTEKLIEDIKKLFEEEKGNILAEQLLVRAERLLAIAKEEIDNELSLMKLNYDEVKKEKKEQELAIKNFYNTRSNREHQFRSAWEEAFRKCENSILEIRNGLKNDYKTVIQNTTSGGLNNLASVVFSDVQASFKERLEPVYERFNIEISEVQKVFLGSVQKSLIGASTNLENDPNIAEKSTFKNSLSIASAASPALLTSAFAASTPLLAGAAITSVASTASATVASGIYAIPLIGPALSYLGVQGLATAPITLTAGATVTALGAVSFSVAGLALGYAAYKAYGRWKSLGSKQRNELAVSTMNMIDDAYSNIIERIIQDRKSCDAVLRTFNESIDLKIQEAESRVSFLLENRPSPNVILALESGQEVLGKLERS